MIILDAVTMTGGEGAKKRSVLTAASVSLPSNRRIAVLGSRAQDKILFINLLAGVVLPNAGRLIRNARVSFPAGHVGGFTRDLSVRLNVAHAARLYGADVDSLVDFVAKISRLGPAYNKPYGELPRPARQHLSQLLAFSIPFDVYLLNDDVVGGTEKRFNEDVRALFQARRKTSGMIIASKNAAFAREFCDMGLLLSDGQVRLFEDLEEGLSLCDAAGSVERKKERRLKRKTEKATRRLSEEKKDRRLAKRKIKRAQKTSVE